AAGDHRLQRRIGGRLAEAVEPSVLQVENAWRELEAQHRAQSKDVIGISAAISMMTPRQDLALMVEQRVQHMQRLACRSRDQLGEERRIAVGEVRSDAVLPRVGGELAHD